MTRLFGILGDPIDQARSPEVFNELFHLRGVDALMAPMRAGAENFAAALSGLRAFENLADLVITAPHKAAVSRLMKKGSHRATPAMAGNALRPCEGEWEGDLFDGEGFVRGMAAEGKSVAGARCAVVGIGGAGAAIAFGLLEAGAESLSLWDKDRSRAETLQGRLRAAYSARIDIAEPDAATDIAINATPLGMRSDDPLPFAVDRLRREATVADAVMKPPLTCLLREAERHGCAVQPGRHMLDHQVEAIWSFFGLP